MPFSTDVNLPRKHRACFPSRCVRCGCDAAGSTVRLWTHTIGWWTWILWSFGRGFSIHVPACKSCGWKIRIQRIGGIAVVAVVAALFLFFVWPLLDDVVAKPLRRWLAMGLILAGLAPYFLWEIIFPPAIEITAYSDSVDYEFRDVDYAIEFSVLNDDAEWVKID